MLFQMSPLPVCVVSLLPCGAPEGCQAQQYLRKWRTCEGVAVFACQSRLEGTACQASGGLGSRWNVLSGQASSWAGAQPHTDVIMMD